MRIKKRIDYYWKIYCSIHSIVAIIKVINYFLLEKLFIKPIC